jgi:hypothetical protein
VSFLCYPTILALSASNALGNARMLESAMLSPTSQSSFPNSRYQQDDGMIQEYLSPFSIGKIDEPGGREMGDVTSIWIVELYEAYKGTVASCHHCLVIRSATRPLTAIAPSRFPAFACRQARVTWTCCPKCTRRCKGPPSGRSRGPSPTACPPPSSAPTTSSAWSATGATSSEAVHACMQACRA